MKTCPNCNAQLEDDMVFCVNCGTNLNAAQTESAQTAASVYMQADPYDHTAEFDAKDISDNKVMAMICYLFGFIGIIVALIAAKDSPYTAFHVRQALKIQVALTLATIVMSLTFWLILPVIAYVVLVGILTVAQYICFFQVCSGKAKEPFLINKLNFMK